jgi:hypothetical protein
VKALALFVLCCLAAGTAGVAAQRERSFAGASKGVHVNVTWTVKTFMMPGMPGPPFPVDSIATAHAAFSGRDVVTSSASLDQFLYPFTGHNVDWVHSAKDGCGATTPLAFVPDASAVVPYIAFFTTFGQKGCLPMALLFAPVRTGTLWEYRAAPTLELETAKRPSPYSNVPFRRAKLFRIDRVERVRLPSAQQDGPTRWFVDVVYGTIGGTPAIYTLAGASLSALPSMHAGELIEIGGRYRARVAAKV